MASSRIDIVQGTTRSIEIDLVDEEGEPIALSRLENAVAEFYLKTTPEAGANVLYYVTPDEDHLVFKPYESALTLSFAPADTNAIALAVYTFRIKVILEDGTVFYAIDWSPFDLNLGGVAEPAVPVFDETTPVNHNYGLTDDLRYMTPGGSPIANAHIRVYLQSDYVAGNLATPVGVTSTKSDGRWLHTIMVRPGFTYVVQLHKPNEFGPDTATIVA